VISVRACELLERRDQPRVWTRHDVARLRQNFLDVFHAIETNSHGAYRIVTNLAEHEEGDYLIHLECQRAGKMYQGWAG